MSTYAADYLEAIEHLPDGAMLRLEHVSWDEYEQLLDQLAEWRGMRICYDRGRVEIMGPSLQHEVDITNESLSKFPIYAAFLVPEIWRYDGEEARIDHLVNETYIERDPSLSFPFLTSQAMSKFLEQSKTQGQTTALAAFRLWIRAAIQA